ncbi:MAG: Carboxy-peptidase [Parcubacteria group bacterium Athens0714_26]|nr:MAG: Carboxy-peptidase [Parcubacteria group bacterium Athens0714_26]
MKNFLKLNKKIAITGAIIVASVLFAGGVFYAGYKLGTLKPQTLIIKGVSNIEPDVKVNADFSVFWQVWDKLKNEHIKGDKAKDLDMVYGAIDGLVNSLSDPHTIFLRPDDSKKFEQDVNGNFGGIGAEIDVRDSQLMVVSPLEGSPAAKAGLLAGDKIIEIDKKSTVGLSVDNAVKKIRGEIGTKVVLTILRGNDKKPREVIIIRDKIEIPTLKIKMMDDIAYIQLFGFNQNAPVLFYNAVLEVLKNQPKGIVLDLRNDPGGYLEVAVNIAGWFVDNNNLVVTEKFRNGDKIDFRSRGNAALKNLPITVLINKGSASASEILAGALRYYRQAKLVGEQSFGKGTVQELQDLKDGSTIKITIAQWLLPDGKPLDENGLTPDVAVGLTEQDVAANKDPQLDKALEVIKSELNQ